MPAVRTEAEIRDHNGRPAVYINGGPETAVFLLEDTSG